MRRPSFYFRYVIEQYATLSPTSHRHSRMHGSREGDDFGEAKTLLVIEIPARGGVIAPSPISQDVENAASTKIPVSRTDIQTPNVPSCIPPINMTSAAAHGRDPAMVNATPSMLEKVVRISNFRIVVTYI